MKFIKKLLPMVTALLVMFSCNKTEPHGVYYASNFNGYEHLVVDFWGAETIRIFGIKEEKLYLSRGKWNWNSDGTLTITASAIEVKQDLLESANHFLDPYQNKKFESYNTEEFQLEMKILSFEELEHIKSKTKFKSYEIN